MSIIFWVLFVLVSYFLLTIFFGAPYVPTKNKDIESIIKSLKIKQGQIFVDLGCGDGRVLHEAEKLGANVVGYELNPILWLISKYKLKNKKSKVYLGSFWRANLSDADFIYIFSAGPYIKKLTKKLKNELKKGTTIISYGFKLDGFAKQQVVGSAYIYRFDGKVSGR